MTAAPPEVAEILGIPAGRRAARRDETILDDGQAVSITTTWFPPAVAAAAPKVADSLPLPAGYLAYIGEVTGNRASRMREENAAAAVGTDDAALLGVQPGTPVLLTRTRFDNADGHVVAYSEAVTVSGNWRTRTYTVADS